MKVAAQPGQADAEGRTAQRHRQGQPRHQPGQSQPPAPVSEQGQHEAKCTRRTCDPHAATMPNHTHSSAGCAGLKPDHVRVTL